MTNNYFEGGVDIDLWHKKRRAKLTASTNYKLIGAPSTYNLYIKEKALEQCTSLWERPELEQTASLLWGNVYEQPAHERYIASTKNYSMTYIGRDNPIFFPYPNENLIEDSGGTPDAANILESGSIDYGAEYKCPRNPSNHFDRLKWTSQWDIKENYIQCYTQIQNLIMITGASGWDFISYDERMLSKKHQIVIIEVKPDKKFIDNLELKLYNGVRDKYKKISEHIGVEIKSKSDWNKYLNN